ncbi:hypothetical protein K461DRAFT_280068 [Myriangium duriaei CBS 260.36]|uniref:Uncharacterized protein n=1 Tax=Myriangium duriaei CBS 260.36 TaxID=1168546 RepID=A0A9P4MEJ9_9PEZI|nr:hypothetical protein K461DRAFT_280068 [Myriangium duriaei CBS 260.36]
MSETNTRNWFVPGDGIRREIITRDICFHLGADATVKPGEGEYNGKKTSGFIVKAYRNLTSEMIRDLQKKSERLDRHERHAKKSEKRGRTGEEGHLSTTYGSDGTAAAESGRTYQEHAGQYAAGNNSPRVEVPYHQPPSRHDHNPDMMDYEPAPPQPRMDPYARTPVHDPRHSVGSHGERAMYAPPAHIPSPGYVVQGDSYAADPGYRQGSYPPNPYQGHPGYPPSRGPEPVDPRYARREDHHYQREEPRYARDDSRYPGTREEPRYPQPEEMRHRSSREDSRYAYASPREEPRYPPQPDPRDDQRYRQPQREDPRYPSGPSSRPGTRPQPGYQEPPHDPRYSYTSPPAPIPQGPIPGMQGQATSPPPIPQPGYPPASQYNIVYDAAGRPYQTTAVPVPQQRGAPSEDPSRHRHR